MTPQQLEALRLLIAEKTAEICESPETARAWLYKLGTHNLDGSLTKQYGGEATDSDHPAFREG